MRRTERTRREELSRCSQDRLSAGEEPSSLCGAFSQDSGGAREKQNRGSPRRLYTSSTPVPVPQPPNRGTFCPYPVYHLCSVLPCVRPGRPTPEESKMGPSLPVWCFFQLLSMSHLPATLSFSESSHGLSLQALYLHSVRGQDGMCLKLLSHTPPENYHYLHVANKEAEAQRRCVIDPGSHSK